MANVKSRTTYTVKLNEEEYFFILQGLESGIIKLKEMEFPIPACLATLYKELKESRT